METDSNQSEATNKSREDIILEHSKRMEEETVLPDDRYENPWISEAPVRIFTHQVTSKAIESTLFSLGIYSFGISNNVPRHKLPEILEALKLILDPPPPDEQKQ